MCKQAIDVVDILEERIETKTYERTLPKDVSDSFVKMKEIESVIY